MNRLSVSQLLVRLNNGDGTVIIFILLRSCTVLQIFIRKQSRRGFGALELYTDSSDGVPVCIQFNVQDSQFVTQALDFLGVARRID